MPHPYTLADGEEWVGDAARKWREDRAANFAVEDPATGVLVGSCGLRVDVEKQSGEIGYLVHRDHRRRGVAAACVALLTDWGFDELGLGRLQIRADTRNVASRRTTPHPAMRSRRCCATRTWSTASGSPTCCTRCCRRPSAVERPGGPAARLRLAAADRRPSARPALRARGRFGGAGGLQRSGRAEVDLRRSQRVHARRRRGVHRRFAPPPAARRSRPAGGDRRRDRRAPRERQPRPLRRPAGGRDRLLGEEGARRRGAALGAARLVVDWAFKEHGIERLEILTYPGNEASQALAARLGFTRECLLRGFLAPEADKSREGRVVPSADGGLPPRDDQVQFVRLRSDPAPPD